MNKTETHGFVNQLLVFTLVIICFSGSIGLGTVYLRQQKAQVANTIRQIEIRTDAIERHLAETNASISAESSASALARRNAEWNLGLVAPKEQQIVRVTEPVEERLERKRHDELYAQEAGAISPIRFVLGGDSQ
ncbi:MAG TPA: hypothetical protein VFT72_15045 [Opitutaceae bacterium]|nr:hypothetical protein [Opitutaceae bacterium]